MQVKVIGYLLLLAIAGAASKSCGNSERKHADANGVYVDSTFTRMYMPDSGGVTSADGTISFTLQDGSSIFMTGDCFTEPVINGARAHNCRMINNAFVHISKNGKYSGSIYGEIKEGDKVLPRSLYVPAEADTSSVPYWYWPAHAFQRPDGRLYVTMAKLYLHHPGQWGFRTAGVDILKVDPETFQMTDRVEIIDRNCETGWSQCILAEGDDVYLYGTGPWGDLNVWKTTADDLEGLFCHSCNESPTEPGRKSGRIDKDQNGNPAGAFRCEGVDVPVSAQFSVFKHKDKYVLVTKNRFSSEIYSFLSDTPTGPWGDKRLLYVTQEQDRDSTLFTYNAMAHPQYINRRGELLICYNINSSDIIKTFDDVSTYRPVFLRVPMAYILGKK